MVSGTHYKHLQTKMVYLEHSCVFLTIIINYNIMQGNNVDFLIVVGLPFTELCKPSFSVELKALLDNYFSSTEAISRDRTVIARGKTVGSSKEIQRHLQLGTNRMKR